MYQRPGCGPEAAAQAVYSLRLKNDATNQMGCYTVPAARRAKEPGSHKALGSSGINSTTNPPAPADQARSIRKVPQPPIGRKATRWLGHPVATPQTQHSVGESEVHALFADAGSTRCKKFGFERGLVQRGPTDATTPDNSLLVEGFYEFAEREKRPNRLGRRIFTKFFESVTALYRRDASRF